jgi:hypothetical protein
MKQVEQTEIRELSLEEIESVSGGTYVSTSNSLNVSLIKAKNYANGSIFSGNSSFHDTLDNNNNLP